MNTDQLYGQWRQFKGDLQQTWEDFTDKDLAEIGQSYEKFVGKVQERYGDRKPELMNWAATWHQPGLRRIEVVPLRAAILKTVDDTLLR